MSGVESDQEAAREAVEVTRRAIRRLDVLEWVTFAAAVVVAILGGAAVAGLASGPLGMDFRTTWIGASLLLFVVPGLVVLVQKRRTDKELAERIRSREEADG